MQEMPWPVENTDSPQGFGHPAVPDALRRLASGSMPLAHALGRIAVAEREQLLQAQELLEQEAWALAMLLAGSEAYWQRPGRFPLRFSPQLYSAAEPQYFELGSFAHLASLSCPTDAERELADGGAPRWARVVPHKVRQAEGHAGTLGHGYTPASHLDAVAALGLAAILSRLNDTVRADAIALCLVAQHQAVRREQITAVESTLFSGAGSHDTALLAYGGLTRVFSAITGRGHLLGAAQLWFASVLLCLITGAVMVVPLLVLSGALAVIWYSMLVLQEPYRR